MHVQKWATPSSILRNSVLELLNNHRDDIENYRTLKRQSPANNNGHQLINIENSQILGNEHLHPPRNDGRTHHQGMNMAPVKETEYLREKVHDKNNLPMNSENLEPSSIQRTQEELKITKREMQFPGNNEQPRAEDPIANLYKLDLAKFMYTLVMLDRQNKSKLVYLEVDEVTKEVLHIISSYSIENWKKEKAHKI
jgi:hypothetical protein